MVNEMVEECEVKGSFPIFQLTVASSFYRCGGERSRWGLQEAGLAELATNGEPEKETPNCPFLAEG